MLNINKYTALSKNLGLMERVRTEDMKKEETLALLSEKFGWTKSDIQQVVDAEIKTGSSYVIVPKFVLGLDDIKAAGMHYLINTVWEYEIVQKNLDNCFFLGNCSYGKLEITFYVHESCSQIFTIIKGIKGAQTFLALELLDNIIGSSYSVTNIETAGYLGTQESMPDIFILQDEVVFLPITGIDGNPYTLCSFSESLENESKTRVSFDPPRFLKKNINVQDEEFNKALFKLAQCSLPSSNWPKL